MLYKTLHEGVTISWDDSKFLYASCQGVIRLSLYEHLLKTSFVSIVKIF